MSANPLWAAADAATLRSVGRLAAHQAELDQLEAALQAAPLWQPGRELLAQIAWRRDKLRELQASWGRRLVVALAGPSGAGKSSLLNALAGRALSPVGLTRPTTRAVVAYVRSPADAEALVEHCGREHVQIEADPQAPALEYLTLIDTPDTNTLPENQRLLALALEQVDVLLAVFPAQNPKMLDNIAFLRPYVAQLPPDAVAPVLNMVDRIPRRELLETILPDFERAIRAEWGAQPERVFLTSAKRALAGADFPPDEAPLHDLNQFADLQHWLTRALNRASQLTDRRLARAERLLALIREQTSEALASSSAQRAEALAALRRIERAAQHDLTAAVLAQAEQTSALEAHAALYAALAPRWWGPVGWIVAIWALGARLAGWLGRRLAPRSPNAPAPALWAGALQARYAADWPPVADALARAGFDPAAVRGAALWRAWADERGQALSAAWEQARDASLGELARRLSGWALQTLWNAPTLGLAGWVGFEAVRRFIAGQVLPADYFRHALIALAAVWLAGWALLQVVISWALRGPLRRAIARRLQGAADLGAGALQAQLRALGELECALSRKV